jgi:hypothetical protein
MQRENGLLALHVIVRQIAVNTVSQVQPNELSRLVPLTAFAGQLYLKRIKVPLGEVDYK